MGGGFVSGEVYDDARGLPLAGVSVLVNGQPATSGPLGRFDVFTNDSFVEVVVSQLGYTSVERVVTVDQLAGTVVLGPWQKLFGCGSFGTARIAHFLSDLTVQRSLVVRLVRG